MTPLHQIISDETATIEQINAVIQTELQLNPHATIKETEINGKMQSPFHLAIERIDDLGPAIIESLVKATEVNTLRLTFDLKYSTLIKDAIDSGNTDLFEPLLKGYIKRAGNSLQLKEYIYESIMSNAIAYAAGKNNDYFNTLASNAPEYLIEPVNLYQRRTATHCAAQSPEVAPDRLLEIQALGAMVNTDQRTSDNHTPAELASSADKRTLIEDLPKAPYSFLTRSLTSLNSTNTDCHQATQKAAKVSYQPGAIQLGISVPPIPNELFTYMTGYLSSPATQEAIRSGQNAREKLLAERQASDRGGDITK